MEDKRNKEAIKIDVIKLRKEFRLFETEFNSFRKRFFKITNEFLGLLGGGD